MLQQVEISRMLLLTSAGNIETLSFSIPRADKLLNFYQDDIFGLVRAKIPSMTCQEWFDGSDKAPILTSMKPNGEKVSFSSHFFIRVLTPLIYQI
jgi:hypothetical protein